MNTTTTTTTTTEIPEREYRTEIFEVAVEDAKQGDTYAKAGKELVIDSIKVGTKWVELRAVDGGLILRAEVGTMIIVARDVETQESKDRRERAQKNEAIRHSIAKRSVNTATLKALAKLTETAEKGYLADSFQTSALLAAQAEDKVYDGFAAFVTNNVGRVLEDGTVVDETAALEAYTVTLKERLIDGHDITRGLSRSTSMVSNLMNDAEREATSEFIRHSRWWMF